MSVNTVLDIKPNLNFVVAPEKPVVTESTQLEILDPRDAAVLLEGGESVGRKIMEDFPDKLPNIVLLPDTSGRILKYLMDPIFEQIATERGVTKPEYFFFQTPANGEFKKVGEELRNGESEAEIELAYIENYEDAMKQDYFTDEEKKEIEKKYIQGIQAIDHIDEVDEILANRMKEIVEAYKDRHSLDSSDSLKTIVVDEIILNEGRSLKMIDQAYKSAINSNGLNMMYGITSLGGEFNHDQRMFSGVEIYSDPDDEENSTQLRYRDKNPSKSGSLRYAYGVEKNPDYTQPNVKRLETRNIEAEVKFRKDVKMIGKMIAERI